MFGIIIIVLLLVALKNCLSLDNSCTTVYAGKTYTGSYYINGHEGTYISSDTNPFSSNECDINNPVSAM